MNAARAFLLLTLLPILLSACGLSSKDLSGTAYPAISVEGDQLLTKAILLSLGPVRLDRRCGAPEGGLRSPENRRHEMGQIPA